MKTILVDAVQCFVSEKGVIQNEMHDLLETYPNKKILLTGANDEQLKHFGLDKAPYEVFTLKHDPEKTNPLYYKKMLDYFKLTPQDVVYFEHARLAVESAKSVGIITYYYDNEESNLDKLKEFLDINLKE